MAYFSALGGTGGTSATITVTYSEDFYGVTITATNGTTTLTKTATSSGTLVFDVSEGGTWVVSGTVEGATYSESVDVTFEYTAPPLVALPDGSTALPVNDIQMWLKCAAIRDKTTYTTLADVLGDTETLIALCADSNACDYMARSTTWALAEGLVPTMTSATSPSGQVISSGDYDASHGAWRVFDGNDSTEWASTNPAVANTTYIGYRFGSGVNINRLRINQHSTNYFKKYKVQGSNDGFLSDINDVTDVITETNAGNMSTVDFTNSATYNDYRLLCVEPSTPNSTAAIYTLQFYESADITTNSTAMLIVGKYNYCANKLIANNTWFDELAESDYWEYVFDVCVPKMTSNTAPSGECFAKDVYSGQNIYAAFDRNPNIGCHTSTPASVVDWYIGYKFTHSVKVYGIAYRISQSNSQAISFTIKLQGTKDGGSTWTDLTEVSTLEIPAATPITGALPVTKNLDNYDWYRIYTNGKGVTPLELQFLGHTDNSNYIPLVPVMTSNTTPSGVASAGEENARAYYAFDGNPSTKWYSGSGASGTVTYIGYQFPSAVEISAWGFAGNTDSPLLAPTKVVIQKSDDGVTYTDVQTFDNLPNDGQFHMYTLDSPITTAYIRAETYKRTVSGNTYAQFSRLQFYREPTVGDVLIHSAVEDNIFYMDDGSPVALCGIPIGDTIDVDMESFKGQTLTLISTVAKDPTNLSNDFSMNVRITPNITEIYLMPLKELYWYGHESKLVEDTSPANGWSHSGWTFIAPNRRTNYIDLHASTSISDTKVTGIGTKWANNLATNVHCVYTGITLVHDEYGILIICSTKDIDGTRLSYESLTSNTMTKITKQIATGNYAGLDIGRSRQAYVHALWLE